MQEEVDIPSQEDVQALDELHREAIAKGALDDQDKSVRQQAESTEIDAEDKELLDQVYDKIGKSMQTRTDELEAGGMTRQEAGAKAIEEFFGPKNPKTTPNSKEQASTPGSSDLESGELRPSKPKDVAKALADNPEAMDPDNEDGIGLAGIASIGQEPWTVDVPKEEPPVVEPPEPPESSEAPEPTELPDPTPSDDDPRKKIGEAVSERIEELVEDGMTEPDAHTQAHNEFWDKTPEESSVDDSDSASLNPPEDDEDRDRESTIKDTTSDSPTVVNSSSGDLRPSTPKDVAKALADNPEAMDPDNEDGIGLAGIASIGQEPWTVDVPKEEPPVVEPPEPPEPPEDRKPLRIGMASLDRSVEAASSDAAEVIKDRETTQRGVRGFLRKIWHGGAFQALPFQRNRVRARQQILESGNIHIHTGGSQAEMDATVQSVVGKITHDNIDDFLATGSGETHRRITDQDDPRAVEVRATVTDLIRQYVAGTLDDDNFEETKNLALRELAVNNPEYLGEGNLFADNLLEIAQVVRSRVSHELGVEAILADAIIDIGQIRTDAKTEAHYDRVDRIIDRLQDTRYGGLVNETTLVTAVSAMAAVGKITENIATSKALKMVGIGFIAAAVIGYRRQSKVVKDERRHHLRERASGLEITSGSKRRERLEATRYQTISATGATEIMDGYFGTEDDRGLRELNDLTPEQFMQALLVVSEIQTRDRISDGESIDLFDYISAETIGDERLQLQASVLYTSAALSRYLEAQGGVSWLLNAGLVDAATTSIDEIRTNFDTMNDAAIRVDITERDRVFTRLRRKEALMAGTIGATVGVTIGFATQELMAHIPGIGDSLYGLGEGPVQPGGRGTTLAGLFGPKAPGGTGNLIDVGGHSKLAEHVGISSKQDSSGNWVLEQAGNGKKIKLEYDQSGMLTRATKLQLTEAGYGVHEKLTTPSLSGKTVTETIGNNKITLPEEFKIHQLDHGRYELLNPDGSKAHDIGLNFDGSLDDQTLIDLKAKGLVFSETPHTITETTTVTKSVPQEVIKDHFLETKHVHRQLWAANNTPAPKYDLNELRADAGGANGSWFNEQGDVVIDVSRMTPNGSFQGAYHVNPLDLAAQGKLSLGVSISQDTQATPFNFPIKTMPDGRVVAVIPKSSVVHQLFGMNGGKRVFNGRVFEVLHNTGQINPNGSEDVVPLASLPGTNNPGNITDQIITSRTIYDTVLSPKPPDTSIQVITYDAQPLVDAPPVIPFYARRGLERLRDERRQPYAYGEYGNYGIHNPELIEEVVRNTIPELIENPRALIPTGEAVNWYEKVLKRNKGRSYVRAIKDIVETSPELSSMNSETDAIIAIPVGGFEGENIYTTLSLYGQQPESDTTKNPILLHVNWKASDATTPESQAEIKKTLDAIERAKSEFPHLKIAIIQTAWTDEEVDEGIIGMAVRKLYDTAILATDQAIENGKMDTDHEVVVIRNDADGRGISEGYIGKMVEQVTDSSNDIAIGRLKWGIEQTKGLPGFAVALQFLEGVRGSARRAREKGIDVAVQTTGANSGIRISTLASVGSLGFSSYTGAGSDDLEIGHRVNLIRKANSPLHLSLYGKRHGSLRGIRAWLSSRDSVYDEYELTGDDTVTIANGATIDTNTDRLLACYLKGKSIGKAWNDFNERGHKDRSDELPDVIPSESLDDFDTIASKIEFQISGIITDWKVDPRMIEMELRRSFPPEHESDVPMYEIKKVGKTTTFTFTEEGKKLLQNRLQRNNRGQHDPLGSRRMRVNYGVVTPKRTFPKGRTPRLVKGIS